MRILMLGAGGTGGYFGGRLIEAGADVTFLVRPGRAARLAVDGLTVLSPFGDFHAAVKTVTADAVAAASDLVILSCKAYDLAEAIAAVRPAVGSGTMVLPLLNGLSQFEALDQAFGVERVIGGLCHIATTLGPSGEIRHLNRIHSLTFGERAGGSSPRVEAIAAAFAGVRFEARRSDAVIQDLWEKFAFLATLAGITCLMRASIGVILKTDDGAALVNALLEECYAVATAAGQPPRPNARAAAGRILSESGSTLTASMLRDLEAGGRTEADHVLGDLVKRAAQFGLATPILRLAYAHLQAYERRREAAASAPA